jgi:hypothetical protein
MPTAKNAKIILERNARRLRHRTVPNKRGAEETRTNDRGKGSDSLASNMSFYYSILTLRRHVALPSQIIFTVFRLQEERTPVFHHHLWLVHSSSCTIPIGRVTPMLNFWRVQEGGHTVNWFFYLYVSPTSIYTYRTCSIYSKFTNCTTAPLSDLIHVKVFIWELIYCIRDLREEESKVLSKSQCQNIRFVEKSFGYI